MDEKALGTSGLDYLVSLIKSETSIMKTDIATLKFAVFNSGSNPWVVTFTDTSGIDLISGVFNAASQRLEA